MYDTRAVFKNLYSDDIIIVRKVINGQRSEKQNEAWSHYTNIYALLYSLATFSGVLNRHM